MTHGIDYDPNEPDIMKKNKFQFHSELKSAFPEIAQLRLWNENDNSDELFSSSELMNEIGEIVIKWAEQNEIDKIQRLLLFFEQSYKLYDDDVTAYIYTDFLPTIISMENAEFRELIKRYILEETMKHYNQLIDLGFYIEN